MTDSTATGAERASAAAGLGRLGLVGMDQIFGGGADAAMLNQVMQNPTLSQMMQTLLSKSHMIKKQQINFKTQKGEKMHPISKKLELNDVVGWKELRGNTNS
ncbi:hypothetical protein SAY87_007285 [Trapa incisa]|uniref:Uncharacterized protein n=1 Tax=Trapa incisa TaxID=236973 RepID=A0AAN7Q0N5_9MYRT|nr:hypothetical protein SAY87_007285 [Trapa incisa]